MIALPVATVLTVFMLYSQWKVMFYLWNGERLQYMLAENLFLDQNNM